MSAVSSLAPGLLGYRKFNDEENKFKDFVDIKRFEGKFNDKIFIPKLWLNWFYKFYYRKLLK